MSGPGHRPFGVYLHIPFCARRCDYCAFAAWSDRSHLVETYVDALARDVDRHVAAGLPPASSVFVGGGTPSLVSPRSLADVVARIPLVPGAEVTVECNPETVTASHIDHYLAAGVNRLSFGVQSMVGSVLESLGRQHDVAAVHRAVALARHGGVASLSLDLIYGAAGETVADWRTTLEETLALGPDHLSAYALTVEAGTPLADDPSRHPDDDDQAAKYLLADEILTGAGFEWYEISNWARPGHRCRHNLLYWSQGDYRGFGCAAHSHVGGRRWWNVRTPERYVALVDRGVATEAGAETLDRDAQRLEGRQLALRTSSGVPVEALDRDEADQLSRLVTDDGGRWVLTVDGRLLANEVALRLR
jgi:putative oxygen-independent coproporphyrinogen III oxidase